MDNRLMQKLVQAAWNKLPHSFQRAMIEDKKAPRNDLRLSIAVEGQTVTFRATPGSIVGYVHYEADIIVDGVDRKPIDPEPSAY